ncbi:flavin monoamine oxidase family protein [Sphingobacterium suaedae]|uniref:Tryptophan 2-monooxygenase n=1 Tax=Sphingobacterium suaedae TaxID=1686402 RepID=A0ABW5KJZ8_9SPHI
MEKKYIIIGGGAAGIGAAYKILESSKTAKVHLFEAQSILGGRARTDVNAIKGLAFDKGCVYIQDPKNPKNPWPGIAKELGFDTVVDNTGAELRIKENGIYRNDSIHGIPEINEFVQSIEDQFESHKDFPNLTVCCQPRVSDEHVQLALGLSPYGPFTESTEPWNYIASDRFREATGNWGNNLFVRKGLGTLVRQYGENLSNKYGKRFQITYKSIKTIKYGHFDDSQKNDDQSRVVTVVDSSGQEYQADACIVTIPVSLLKKRTVQFIPPLPLPYQLALKSLMLGSYKKIAVQLNKMPIDIKDDINYYLYNEDPHGVWQYYRLSYFPKNVLIVHTAGNFAEQLDFFDERATFDLFADSFKKAYNDQKLTFNRKFGTTNWDNNQYSLGAYSYTQPFGHSSTSTLALDARKQMAKPIGRLIYFAGEAYNLEAYGTLHGAYIDGQEAAENMLRDTD